MKNFLFLGRNNLTSQTLNFLDGTATALNMYDDDLNTNWDAGTQVSWLSFHMQSSGNFFYYPPDGRFTLTTIILEGINWKNFKISDGSFTISAHLYTGPTTVAEFTNNSETTLFLIVQSFSATPTYTITVASTIDGLDIKCGQWKVMSNISELDYNPANSGYKPKIKRTAYEHEMQDGGVVVYEVNRKFQTSIRVENINDTQRDELFEVFNYTDSFFFIPNATGTAWDGKNYKCEWTGKFPFYNYTDNKYENGFKGNFKIQEASF